jgi:ADP-ribose pyrophosphatase
MTVKRTRLLGKPEILYSGRVFSVERQHVLEPNGTQATKDIVRHPGSAVILPIFDNGKILLIRQFRVALKAEVWELPAGTRDSSETFLQTARRELQEETGFRATSWRKLVEYFPSPGFLNERMAIFVARGLQSGKASPEDDEQITVEPVSMDRAVRMMRSGQIQDSKTLVGILFWHKFGKSFSH